MALGKIEPMSALNNNLTRGLNPMTKKVFVSMIIFLTAIVTFSAEGLDFRFSGKAVVDFHNKTGLGITVILNNNSESHPIAAHSQASFTTANIGDTPIFHVKNLSGVLVFSGQVGMLGAKTTFEWDGSKFESPR
jgi:hypothetical protein